MAKLGMFISNGCEEVEALTVVDLARRAGFTLDMIQIQNEEKAKGSHGITFETEKKVSETDFSVYDGVILPGGLPGTNYLKESAEVKDTVKKFAGEGKLVAAICAAPTALGLFGVLEGKKATCYPGLEKDLTGAEAKADEVVRDGNIITSRGVGTAIPFALAIIEYFDGEEKAREIGKSIVYG